MSEPRESEQTPQQLATCLESWHLVNLAPLERELKQAAALIRQQATALATAERERDEARAQVGARDGTLMMTVHRLGGMVEGRPTERVNFLQRVDELVAIEAAVDDLRERLEEAQQWIDSEPDWKARFMAIREQEIAAASAAADARAEQAEAALATAREATQALIERVKRLPTPVNPVITLGDWYCRWCGTEWPIYQTNAHPPNGCLWADVHADASVAREQEKRDA